MDEELLATLKSLVDSPQEREEYFRGPIAYPGCKERSLPELMPLLPVTDTWVDVFGGTGVVTLNRPQSKLEVFNDISSGVVAFYRCIVDSKKLDQLCTRLDLTVHSREEYIYCKKTWKEDQLDDVERAARWYYSIAYSFGSVGRNFGRSLNPVATISGDIKSRIPLFETIHKRFERVQIENLDWRLMLKDYDSPTAVLYLDPPYYGADIYEDGFSKADHIELCTRVFNCEGFVAVSSYENELYDKFPWDSVHKWPVRISVTSKALKTETSNLKRIGKSSNIECLYIKEFNDA